MIFKYDDSNLISFIAELGSKKFKREIDKGLRPIATKLRKAAISNLRSSGLRTDRKLEKGIRGYPIEDEIGIKVTIQPQKMGKNGKGEAGMHTNRRGLKKPVLFWADLGTKDRRTKGNGTKRAHRKRAAHNTGRMRSYGFMAKTDVEMRPLIKSQMEKAIVESLFKMSQKYGCK